MGRPEDFSVWTREAVAALESPTIEIVEVEGRLAAVAWVEIERPPTTGGFSIGGEVRK